MSQREKTSFGFVPDPVYDDFGRVTNLYYDEYNNLIAYRNSHLRWGFWTKGKPFDPPHVLFRQIRYEPLSDTKPKLVLATECAMLNCGEDI